MRKVIFGLVLATAGATFWVGSATAALTCGGRVATIVGTDGPDLLIGTNGPDVIVGRGGADVIKGLGGPDVICGGNGNDQIYGGLGRDLIAGMNGNDVIRGGIGNDTLTGGPGGDRLWGGPGNDILRGFKDGDVLRGEAGTDTMYGGVGNDILDGGPDSNLAFGGSGIDACYFASEALPSTCEQDQLNVSWSSNLTASDIVEVLYDEDPSTGYIDQWAFTFPTVNGTEYRNGFGINHEDTDVGESSWFDFDLGRDYRRIAVRVGLRDDSIDTTAQYRFEVIGDNVQLAQSVVGFGESRVMSVDISNVLRLRLKVTSVAGSGICCSSDTYAVWIDPRVSANTKLYPAPPTG